MNFLYQYLKLPVSQPLLNLLNQILDIIAYPKNAGNCSATTTLPHIFDNSGNAG